MEQLNNDIDSNTDNHDQFKNIDNSQEPTINTSDNDEKSTERCSREPAINEDINTPSSLQNKRNNYNILEDNIITLKADMITMKNFMMQEIFNITQRITNLEQTNCKDEVKHLREENNSKSEIIKILSENVSSIAISTNTHKPNVERLRKYQIVLITCSIKFRKICQTTQLKQRLLEDLNFAYRLENLRLQNDSTNMPFQNKRTDNPLFISNPALVAQKSMRMRNQNNKCNTFPPNKIRRRSICTTKKYLKIYVPRQRVAPGIASYGSATKSKNQKVSIIGNSHLKKKIKGNLEKNLAKDLATLNALVVRISNNEIVIQFRH